MTPDLLRQLYVDELLTEAQIAALYGTTQVSVGRWRKKWGIPTLGKTGRISAKLPPLSARQEMILYGSLLGDGCLCLSGSGTARFSESHSETQVSYLEWKAKELEAYVRKVIPTRKQVGETIFYGRRLYTYATEHLMNLYDNFYSGAENRKVFPSDLPQRMTPLVLAIWYLDDGGILGKSYPRISFGLDPLSLDRAIGALHGLGLFPRIHDGRRPTEKTITFPGQNQAFYAMIREHVPDCMRLKIPQSIR